MVIASLEDLSTLKLCNSVISGEDFVGLYADYKEWLPQQIKCQFSNLFAIMLFVMVL